MLRAWRTDAAFAALVRDQDRSISKACRRGEEFGNSREWGSEMSRVKHWGRRKQLADVFGGNGPREDNSKSMFVWSRILCGTDVTFVADFVQKCANQSTDLSQRPARSGLESFESLSPSNPWVPDPWGHGRVAHGRFRSRVPWPLWTGSTAHSPATEIKCVSRISVEPSRQVPAGVP